MSINKTIISNLSNLTNLKETIDELKAMSPKEAWFYLNAFKQEEEKKYFDEFTNFTKPKKEIFHYVLKFVFDYSDEHGTHPEKDEEIATELQKYRDSFKEMFLNVEVNDETSQFQ